MLKILTAIGWQVWLVQDLCFGQSAGPHDGIGTEAATYAIHLLHEVDMFDGIVEEVYLVAALHQAAVFDTDEADELASFVQAVEDIEDVLT